MIKKIKCAKVLTKDEKHALEEDYCFACHACSSLMDVCDGLVRQCNDHRKKKALESVFLKVYNVCVDLRLKLQDVFPAEDLL